ncbi:MAG: [protein-PII] uridylyltransferase [Desulfobacterales bacterium]|nr:[protein-PII] uridylyltransferase [Desulfobacterales bacterium]
MVEKNLTPYKDAAQTLQQQQRRLTHDFLKGQAPDFMEGYSRLLDDYFRTSFERSIVGPKIGMHKNPYAIIALGGYGRKEQCVHSDVDVLFLFKRTIPKEAEDLICEMIYPLWDIGLTVGHATRSVKECLRIAGQDFQVLTSIMDARFVCGMSLLYSSLLEQLQKKILSRRFAEIISWLVHASEERHGQFGDSTYLLEPDLKAGQGGLRDYHSILWIAGTKSKISQPGDLERNGYLNSDELSALTRALSFIWTVRNYLHHLAGRKCDQLHFEYQSKLARVLKFKRENGQKPVERFLGMLHGQMDFVKQQHLMFHYEFDRGKRRKGALAGKKSCRTPGLIVSRDMLDFVSARDIEAAPELLIKIFEESARLKIPLSMEAKRRVKEFCPLIDEEFRTSGKNVRSFERILTAPPARFNVLNEMLSAGFLVCYLPEFQRIVNRIQYDEYHLYPVDKHSIRTVQRIKNFREDRNDPEKTDLFSALYTELADPGQLLWAALLHDIGKGEAGKGHSEKGAKIAAALLTRRGYNPREVETVSFLIREHLLMMNLATRRDINDEETALLCARTIQDIDRLKMLYLLTCADAMSTGPKAWNDWTSSLLRDFFFKVLNILEKGELATLEAVEAIENKKNAVFRDAALSAEKPRVEALFDVMSPRYLLYAPAEDIVEHIRLYSRLKDQDFVWQIDETAESNARKITICANNMPGFFSKVAGVFTLNSLDILDAQIFTWRNNIALDIFKVTPPADRLFEIKKWARTQEDLLSALAGKLDIAAALQQRRPFLRPNRLQDPERPSRIIVDNNASSFFTIIEVFTYDFPGLLYRITSALFRCRLDVWVAKIGTQIDQVVDVFYVRDFDGQKIDSAKQVETIKTEISRVLPEVALP